jgi:3'-phosphoadenosine 5'-phosphosulfate sulfotransferase (PAPS reductase)/FAD synthetase
MMQNKITGKKITVWFSCGAASAVAAKKTIELYGESNEIIIVNNPIKEEHEDNQRFLKDVESWLGYKIQFAINPKFPDQSCETVWNKRKFMSSRFGASCTLHLKRNARQFWEIKNPTDYIVLGFTADENKRAERFNKTNKQKLLTPLIDLGITKQKCFDLLNQEGINLPAIYKLGYPNANCVGCVKATSPTYWNLVRKTFPKIYQQRSDTAESLGVKLAIYKGERISLKNLPVDAKGRDLKSYDFECGIFCMKNEQR